MEAITGAAEVSMELKININEYVSVQLTKFGKEAYAKHFRHYKVRPTEIQKDADGWCVFHLWDLMHIFGPVLYMGPPTPFVGNIIRIKT